MPSVSARDPPAAGDSDKESDILPPAVTAAATLETDTASLLATSTATGTTTAIAAPLETVPTTPMEKARQVSELMTKDVLLADQERAYQSLQKAHEDLLSQKETQDGALKTLQTSYKELQGKMVQTEDRAREARLAKETEERNATQLRKVEAEGKERMARVEVENDSLRQEISRLSTSKTSLQTQLTELESNRSLTSSSTAPLEYENTRLRSELDSLSSHASWLESQLSSKSQQVAKSKVDHAKQLHHVSVELERTERERSGLEIDSKQMKANLLVVQQHLEKKQRQVLEAQKNLAEREQELQLEVQTERRMAELQKETKARMEERYNDVVRDMQSMKQLAKVAEQEHESHVQQVRLEIEQEMRSVLDEKEGNFIEAKEFIQKKLDRAVADKLRIEDEFMSRPTIQADANTTATTTLALPTVQFTNADGEPMTLTTLYEKLSSTEEQLHIEQAERKRVELYLERTHAEIEASAPKLRQQRKEYELMRDQLEESDKLRREVLGERNLMRSTLEERRGEEEESKKLCHELKLENRDLAMQVQTLLGRKINQVTDMTEQDDVITFRDVEELQKQNQRLLKEHHRLSSTLIEMEEKLDNNTIALELRTKTTELEELKDDMHTQETIVTDIVQQRDLYRALVTKQNSQLLLEGGSGGSTIVPVRNQLDKFSEIEAMNIDLNNTITKIKADLSSVTNAKVGLEERLIRLDSHSTNLSDSINKLQADLGEAHATAARNKAEASFSGQKLTQVEETLELTKRDSVYLTDRVNELKRLNEGYETRLSETNALKLQTEETLRQLEVKLKLAEAKLRSLQASEVRHSSENASLRSELARHGALQDSMQKIEASLSARSNEEKNRLEEENKRLTEVLMSDRSKSSLMIEQMQNKLDEAEKHVTEKGKMVLSLTSGSDKAKVAFSNLSDELKTVNEKAERLTQQLNAAKIRLGDDDVDTSELQKLKVKETELEAAKLDLEGAKKKIEDYRSMAKASDAALAESTKASSDFKIKMDNEVGRLHNELKEAVKSAKTKQEALEELSKSLTVSREEQEKNSDKLKEKITTLEGELTKANTDVDIGKKHAQTVSDDIVVYKADANAARDNYERELALHADARNTLRKTREELEEQSQLHSSIRAQLDSMKSEATIEKNSWEEEKQKLENTLKELETGLEESRAQNKLLHSQLSSVTETVEAMQSKKTEIMSEAEETSEECHVSEEVANLKKQVSELREVVRYMRTEREMVDTQLQSARRNAEREKAAADIIKRSLDETKAEFAILTNEQQERKEQAFSANNVAVETKLKQNEEQLVLVRESNQFFRDETEKLKAKLSASQAEAENAKKILHPTEQKCRQLEVNKVALQTEKESLVREVDSWKERVQSLLSKFNAIDPEEHKKVLALVEEGKKKYASLESAKATAERESVGAKVIVVRLNKELSKQKNLAETTKSTLEKVSSERDQLKKDSNGKDALEKQVAMLKLSKEKIDTELLQKTEEAKTSNLRLNSLKKILKGNKTKFNEIQVKLQNSQKTEQALTIELEKEKERNKAFLEKRENVVASDNSRQLVPNVQKAQAKKSSNSASQEAVKETAKKEETKEGDSKTKGQRTETMKIPCIPSNGFNFIPSSSNEVSITTSNNEEVSKQGTNSQSVEAKVIVGNVTMAALKDEKRVISHIPKDPSTELKREITKSTPSTKAVVAPSKTAGTSKKAVINKKDNEKATTIADPVVKKDDKNIGTKQSSPVPKSTSKEDILREKIMKKKDEQNIGSETKQPTPVSKPTSKEDILREKIMKKKDEQNIESGIKQPTPVSKPTSKEDALREKIMKKKRRLEEMKGKASIAIPPSKRSDIAVPPSLEAGNKSSAPIQEEKQQPEEVKVKSSVNSVAENPLSDSQKSKSIGMGAGKVTKESTQTTGNKIFGQKDATTIPSNGLVNKAFGSGSTPIFGETSSSGSSTGGAFLNLQPPGTGQSKPFVFGSSSNITLPTPSKIPLNAASSEQAFSAFQSKALGGNPASISPFGVPPSTTTQTSIFGDAANSKKRGIETTEDQSSSKLPRIEEGANKEVDNEKKTGIDADKTT